jgi:enoyl-CoA hydratase/carnithine racemase
MSFFVSRALVGGGVGISIHGSVRVATENTTFAMPETGIGFFPDVGGSHALPRLHNFGTFFGLTGYRIQGFDVKFVLFLFFCWRSLFSRAVASREAGVATHYVLKEFIPELTQHLTKAAGSKDIHHALTHFEDLTKKKSPGKSSFLQQNADLITRCFANQHSVADILKALAKESNPLAHELADTLTKKVSPLAVRLTFEQLKRGGKMSLAECLEMEFRMTQHSMKDHDFFEGVRALLVDKDKKPKWKHASIDAVQESEIAKFFEHVPNELKLPRQR